MYTVMGMVLISAHTLPSTPKKLRDMWEMRGFGWGTWNTSQIHIFLRVCQRG